MFREMRRKNQQLSEEDTAAILREGSSGVLSVLGDDGYPYGVPLSYLYEEGRLYFHCAVSGHKLDALRREAKASFCVIDLDDVKPKEFTSYFRSVIAFGTIRVLENDEEKRAAIEKLTLKYAPDSSPEARAAAIEREWKPLCILEFTLEHMSGKEAIELVRKRKASDL